MRNKRPRQSRIRKKEKVVLSPQEQRKKRVLKLKILRCFRETWKLAFPVMIARLGSVSMMLTDMILLGRYSTQELAYQSIAAAINVLLLCIGNGLLQGTVVLIANAYGKGSYRECGKILRRSVPYAMFIGFVMMALCLPSEFVMKLLGQPPEIAEGSSKVLSVYALGIPFSLSFLVMSSFLEATKRPLPGMILIIIANVCNFVASLVFVYGHAGFPAMGAIGSAMATTLVQVILTVGMFIVIFCIDETDVFGVWVKPEKNKEESKRLRRVGYGIAIAVGLEEGSCTIANVIAGWLGTIALSAYSILLNIVGNVYILANGIGTASAILIGIAKGKKSVLEIRIAGYTGLAFNLILMLACSVCFLFFSPLIASIYTKDPALKEVVIPLVFLCSINTIFDGSQQVLINLLRGMLDIVVPTCLQACSFLLIMMPCLWFFSFKLSYGVKGMAIALIIASIFSMVSLLTRFIFVCRRYEKEGF